MIRFCQDLKIDVVAEGVERPEELSILREAGVRYVQGYLLARPTLNKLVSDEEISY